MRPYWKGYLKLALVSCPIALHAACSSTERIAFRQINKVTGNHLRQQLIDEETREPVAPEHKGRGYEVANGQYLIVEDAELEAIEIESNHTIEIDRFCEIVAAHAVILLEVADDGFDGGAPAHLAADGLGDTPDLAADPDLEPVRTIALVAVDAADRDTCKLFEIGDGGAASVAIIWVAVQRLGMKHELPALGRGDRSGN